MGEKLAIVGIGELPTGWFPEKEFMQMYVEVIKETILDAGIDKNDIDAVVFLAPLSQPLYAAHLTFSRTVEELGLTKCKANFQVFGGGSSTGMTLKAARGLIDSGAAEIVLVPQAQHYSEVTAEERVRFFSQDSGQYEEWEIPYGITYNSVIALIAQRYMYETGTPPEGLAAVAVSLRKWAQLNPNARFRKPMTIEDIFKSKMVSTPLHSLECNVLSDGATAFIVTSAKKAKKISKKPVYILGEGHGGVTHFSIVQKFDRDITRFGYDRAVRAAFKEAGIKLKDVDVAEIYGSYPAIDLIHFEELGFAKRGEGYKYFLEGRTWPGGDTPVCTNGEIQQGHSGLGVGMAVFVEGVRQVRGEAGERQVKDCKIALVTEVGGQIMDSHVILLGKELR